MAAPDLQLGNGTRVPGAHPTRLLNAVYALPMGSRWLSTRPCPAYLGDWPYADDGDGGLPEWFFQTNEDLFFTYVEVYSDGSAVWTGGMGIIWKRLGGAHITRQQLGAELEAWTRENL